MVADHPLFGVGFGAYPVAYSRYDTGSGRTVMNAAHNDYLQIVCETGLIGAGLMVWFLIALAKLCRSALSRREPLLLPMAVGATVGCIGILVHSLVDFHLQHPGTALMFFLLVVLLVGVSRADLDMSGRGSRSAAGVR
jgi:O-antigen ligase